MLAEVITITDESAVRPAAPPVLTVFARVVEPAGDPLRHARALIQRSILTYSLLDRALACGSDLASYQRLMREFIWTPSRGGR
jgi:hypothetical protein